MGRPNKKKKEIEEPKKPVSMLYRERQEEYLEKLGYGKKDATLMQKHGAMNKGLEKLARQNKGDYFENLMSWHKEQQKEELEYEQKLRECRLSISPFECALNKAQMELLLSFFNEHLLEAPITLEELEDIFMGKDRGLTYPLKDWDLFILLFKGLSGEGFDDAEDKSLSYLAKCFKPIEGHPYICICWQKAIEDLEEFTDKKGVPLTGGKIRRRLSTIKNLPEVRTPLAVLERLFEQLVKAED